MATREEWTRLINLSHDLALVEKDLRDVIEYHDDSAAVSVAQQVLYERFGVRV